jgi:histidyl-tRNA synthetase
MSAKTNDTGFRRLAGMADLLPDESAQWVRAEAIVRDVMQRFGFGEIRCPVMEPTELFERGTGESTDIVQKEMYTFTDRGDRSVTLRPEGTPSVVRTYLEESLGAKRQTWKLFYIGPMFRAERPQQGRLRQFHQFGAELIGPAGPEADVETIALANTILKEIGVPDVSLVINSIGGPQARIELNKALREFLARPEVLEAIDADCKRRATTNPLRIFDCKNEKCQAIYQNAPSIDTFLTDEDRSHFDAVKRGLDQLGIGYTIDLRLVRGLDYYTRTTYEFKTTRLGAQDAVCGGGRYDGLVEILGGAPTPAVGFAAGFERVLGSLADDSRAELKRLDVFVCAMGEAATIRTSEVVAALRALGLSADRDFLGRGLKAQMKEADRSRARYVIIIGDDEIAKGQYALRVMDTAEQKEISAKSNEWTRAMFA